MTLLIEEAERIINELNCPSLQAKLTQRVNGQHYSRCVLVDINPRISSLSHDMLEKLSNILAACGENRRQIHPILQINADPASVTLPSTQTALLRLLTQEYATELIVTTGSHLYPTGREARPSQEREIEYNWTQILSQVSQVERLTFKGSGCAAYLDSICSLTHLRTLVLSGLGIKDLSPHIVNLTSLDTLDLSMNDFVNLPDYITQLTALKDLNAHSNHLISLPGSIGNLINLERLEVSYNRITSLPESIGNLKQLRNLGLRSNKLGPLPTSFGELTSLQFLSLDVQRFRDPPLAILRRQNQPQFYIQCCYDRYIEVPHSRKADKLWYR